MGSFVFASTIAAAVGSGLIAGTFFVFSVAVMPAFRRLPGETGMAAMKRINEVILNPMFLGVFLGTAVVSLIQAGVSLLMWSSPGSVYLLAGCLLYLIGTFGVTVAFNVPLNNTLAAAEDHEVWKMYEPRWTAWNHVRAIASTLAVAAFTLAAGEAGR